STSKVSTFTSNCPIPLLSAELVELVEASVPNSRNGSPLISILLELSSLILVLVELIGLWTKRKNS
ncbi:MAG: hypothetical protein O4859_18415, partial [Trichodesmium sp. St18_bin1]|nr:hypothetical protein [Trichodesmium sp. St18_bin1]